jgi:hypothetical protein
MTSLDAMKSAWDAQDRKIDEVLRINRQLLAVAKLDRLRTPLRRFMTGLGIEIALLALALLVVGNFIAGSVAELRFVWPAAALDLWLILALAFTVRQFVAARRIAFEKPVAVLQREIADLRILRLHALRWELLTGQIVWWVPFLILALKLLFGIDAYQYLSATFIAVNLLFGVALIPVAIWLAKRYGRAWAGSPFMRKLGDVIAGRSLTAAQNYAVALSDFDSGSN